MSADNWEICPRCLTEARSIHAQAVAAVMDQYGKIPLEDFDRARAELRDVEPEDYRTFREDYEIYGADQGTVTVDYSGSCESCDLELTFKESRKLEI